jgi:KRAB domain-containing zinc finger protein
MIYFTVFAIRIAMEVATPADIGFECEICLVSCGSKLNLENHVKNHVKKTKQEVQAKQISIKGLTVSDPFKCGLCDLNCSNQADLSVHLTQHTGRKMLVCDFCSFQSAEKLKMKIHATTHKGVKVNPTDSQNRSKSLYKCHKCNVAFKTKDKLQSHNYKMHVPTNQCTVCGYKFPSYSSLQKHLKTICSLSKPQRISESILYDCTMCQKQFAHLKYLKLHLMEHTAIPSKRCLICTKICVNQKALDQHTASIHPL